MDVQPQSVYKVLEITDLHVSMGESFPPQLRVAVYGTVPSPG